MTANISFIYKKKVGYLSISVKTVIEGYPTFYIFLFPERKNDY